MTATIILAALFGAVIGYPLMKLEMQAVHRLQTNIQTHVFLELGSKGLCLAACALPFLLFNFPAALVIVILMAVASFRKILAGSILVGGMSYLSGGWSGFLVSLFCPGALAIPIAIIFFIVRSRSTAKQYTSLGIAEKKPISEENKVRTKTPAQFSLRNMALYCCVAMMFIEFSSLDVTIIQLIYSREKALPRLVQAAKDDSYGATEALKEYGKEALPSELELIRYKFQHGWIDNVDMQYGANSEVANLTLIILEMGEAGSLVQLGGNHKKALRAAANRSASHATFIAVEELVKLKAIPELVSLIGSNVTEKVMPALLQFRPEEIIPVVMKRQVTNKDLYYGNGLINFRNPQGFFLPEELAKYGVSAVPELIPYLSDEHKEVRELATQILLEMGKPAVPELKKIMHSQNSLAVKQSAYILGKLGEPSAIPVLTEKIRLGEDDNGLLAEALRSFWKITD